MGAVGLVCGSRPAAEDAVLEALARAWERSDRGMRIESVEAWVTTVAMNIGRSGLRRVRAERRARERLAGRLRVGEPPAAADRSEAGADVRRALSSLPRRQREATVLRYYLDLDVAEIAHVLGVNEGTVKTSLHRARAKLGPLLSTQDQEEVDHAVGP